MEDGISTAEAARRLRTTPPTIRRLLEEGAIEGQQLPQKNRFRWSISPDSVDSYLADHGKFPGVRTGPRGDPTIERQVARLSKEVEALRSLLPDNLSESYFEALQNERDDLRAKLVSVNESLARIEAATERQLLADAERAALVEHLLGAVSSAERADKLRREALDHLQEALADARRAGHPASLRP